MSLSACKSIIDENYRGALKEAARMTRQFEALVGEPSFADLPADHQAKFFEAAIDIDNDAMNGACNVLNAVERYRKLNLQVATAFDD